MSSLWAASSSNVLPPFNERLVGCLCTAVIVPWEGNREGFAQYVIYSAILQEESHCVTMAGDIFMEKLGMKLALERDRGRCDGGKCWVSEGVGKRREG